MSTYESPVSKKFKKMGDLGTKRIRIMEESGTFREELTPACREMATEKIMQFSNMRDSEERLQRLEIMEKIHKLSQEQQKKTAVLTAMYIELGRRLSDEEFKKEIEEAVQTNQKEEGHTNEGEHQKEDMTINKTKDRMRGSLVPVVRRMPIHLIHGYLDGLNLIVQNRSIFLGKKCRRKLSVYEK
uniref:ATP-dependent Clp protease ATP-binding subunit ClpC n=1 Tax=Lygus hesperus TaxID=30085 RepID=A0A0A9WAF1_LYGHE